MMKMRVLWLILVVLVVGNISSARNLIVPHSQPSPDTFHERYEAGDEFRVWNFYAFKCKSKKGNVVSDYKRVVPNGPNPLHNK